MWSLLVLTLARAQPSGEPEGSHGLVVRLSSSEGAVEAPVVVTLSAPGATPVEIPLRDDGQSGDPHEGDGIWSGTKWLAGDRFEVKLTVGTKSAPAGTVEWDPAASARDLDIAWDGGKATAQARTAAGDPAAGDPAGPTTPGGTSAPAVKGIAAPTTGPAPTAPASDAGGSWIPFVMVGAGLAAIGAGLLLRGRSPAPPPPPTPPRSEPPPASALPAPYPEPGLLGHGTPSLSEGVSVWEIPAADTRALADALLALVAARHQVVWVGPYQHQPSRVHGGPVYPAPEASRAAVQELATRLAERGPVAIVALLPGVGAATLGDWAQAHVGGVLVTDDAADVALPVVACRRVGVGEFVFTTREASVRARAGRQGLEVLSG